MADRKIDGVEYHVDHLPAVEAIQLYADILRILGPAASRLPAIILSLQAESEGQRYMADAAALAALSDVLSRATSEDLTDLLSRIVRVAKIKRPSGSYEDTDLDGDFTGRLGKLPALVKYVLEVQFSDFFPGKSQNGIIGLLTAVLRAPKSAG